MAIKDAGASNGPYLLNKSTQSTYQLVCEDVKIGEKITLPKSVFTGDFSMTRSKGWRKWKKPKLVEVRDETLFLHSSSIICIPNLIA